MAGGQRFIRLRAPAPVGTVAHEILHALGIYHEQSRSDRDAFVEIRWQNIQPNALHNFQLVPRPPIGSDRCRVGAAVQARKTRDAAFFMILWSAPASVVRGLFAQDPQLGDPAEADHRVR